MLKPEQDHQRLARRRDAEERGLQQDRRPKIVPAEITVGLADIQHQRGGEGKPGREQDGDQDQGATSTRQTVGCKFQSYAAKEGPRD